MLLVLVGLCLGGWLLYRNRETLFHRSSEYTLPSLPYSFNALEPYIDTETMEIHYTKHHQAYVDGLNTALKEYPEFRAKPLEYLLSHLSELPEPLRTSVRNFGGGHTNHSFFWLCMSPQGTRVPEGPLKELLEKTFGSFASFKEQFQKATAAVFGSGWVWLVYTKDGALKIITTPNQDSPLSQGYTPLLGLDVWEHAYYLKYQNRRAEYSDAWWHVVHWGQVEKNYRGALANAPHQ